MKNKSALIGKLYSAPAPLWISKEILCVCESACQWQCENLDPNTFIKLWNYMQCLQYRCQIWDSQIWDFFNGKSPKFQVPILDLYCKHCTCRQQQRHKWRRLVLVAVAAYTTQVLTSCLLLVPADQSCAIVEPLVSSSGVAVQLLSPTWDEAAVAAAAVPATTSSTFPLFPTLTVPHGFSPQHPFGL